MNVVSNPVNKLQLAMVAAPVDTLTIAESDVLQEHIGDFPIGATGQPYFRAFLHCVVMTGKKLRCNTGKTSLEHNDIINAQRIPKDDVNRWCSKWKPLFPAILRDVVCAGLQRQGN